MKFIYKWLVVLALSLPLAIQAGQVTINSDSGQIKFSDYTNTVIDSDGNITINGAVSSGTAPPQQSSSSSSSAPGVPSACGSIPNNVILSNNIALTSFGGDSGSIEFEMPKAPKILSHKINTPAGSNGSVSVAGMSWTSTNIRSMWFSDCPGGTPTNSRCAAEGNLFTMRWVTGSSRTSCILSPNKDYYINLSSSSCTANSGCDALVNYKGGWK